ncbi:hypothetical protein T484DRAFT_1946754 [Baffinella frigidus]|nr:hypothetical protein T484DRAFT_1946754 [Cryptophyta sp. CCMP2293]
MCGPTCQPANLPSFLHHTPHQIAPLPLPLSNRWPSGHPQDPIAVHPFPPSCLSVPITSAVWPLRPPPL